MGTQYVQHGDGGNLTLMRLWRKTEPLENAFLVLGYEAQPSWDAAVAGESADVNGSTIVVRARPLMRQSPGGPGVGDTVTYYFNHSLDFDDEEIFGVFDMNDCSKRGGGRGGAPGAAGVAGGVKNASSTSSSSDDSSATGPPAGFNFTSLLNMNSGLHVDRSFREVVWNGIGDPNEEVPEDADNNASAASSAFSLPPLPSAGVATLMRTDARDTESNMNDAVNVTWEILDGGLDLRITVTDISLSDGREGRSFVHYLHSY